MGGTTKTWRSPFLLAMVLASSLLPFLAAAQTTSPTSMVSNDGLAGTDSEVQLSFGWRRPDALRYRLSSLMNAAPYARSAIYGEGNVARIAPGSNSNSTALSDTLAFISCDPPSDGSSIVDTLAYTIGRGPVAVIMFSNTQSGCVYTGGSKISQTYNRLFTMTQANLNDTWFNYASNTNNRVTIGQKRMLDSNSTDTPPTSQTGGQINGGPSPSTAVAMIILYSITGVITALFLIIIITGAVRAHRHPERYGPRNALGRPRQSRARGLARAMLETLPIVKFGERDETKPTDVELAAARATTTDAKNVRDSTLTEAEGEKLESNAESQDITQNGEQSTTRNEEAAAAAPPEEASGCSICTDDFEIGQDVRVLPCDHHFHPACIDPWLLNVSGTCPLCRIDLRPAAVVDDPASTVPESEVFPPPLDPAEQARRASRRHSLIWDVLNPSRMRDASAQERIAALRSVRENRGLSQTEETEARRRRRLTARLQDVFHIRTTPTSTAQSDSLAVPADTSAANASHRSSAIGRIPEVSTEAEDNAAAAAVTTSPTSDWPVSRPRSDVDPASSSQLAGASSSAPAPSQDTPSADAIDTTPTPAVTKDKHANKDEK